ncbi:MAG: hypothetical protein LUE93_12665 [Bacteroides sp.]|nr:hypothetical protein [Bacteroides sp.]
MLIESPHYSLDKQTILKTLWNNNHYGNPNTNMASAVNRLNNILKEVGCNYNIITNEEKQYSLELRDHKPGLYESLVSNFFTKQKYIIRAIKNWIFKPKPEENGNEEVTGSTESDPIQEEPRENKESED